MEDYQQIYIPLSHLGRRNDYQALPKISREYGFNQKHLESGERSSTITNMSYSTKILRICHLTLGDGMNFLPLTEPNPTNNLG
jgi:hypothetical protein